MNKTEMRKNLLPCPWCGTKPSFIEGWSAPAGAGTAWTVTITCQSNKCALQPQLSVYIKHFNFLENARIILRKKALDRWNTRKYNGTSNKKR